MKKLSKNGIYAVLIVILTFLRAYETFSVK